MQRPKRVRTMFAIDGEYDGQVVCPYCEESDGYVHFQGKTQLIPGNDAYDGSEIFDIGVRGDVLVLSFWCEQGRHRWSLIMGEHKGHMHYKVVLTDIDAAPAPQPEVAFSEDNPFNE